MNVRVSVIGLVVMLVSPSAIAHPFSALAQTPETTKDTPLPALPANCRPLPLVGGEGSQVTKTASVFT